LSEAIQTVIDEFKTLSPDISKVIVFKLDGETLAASKDATVEQTQVLIACLNGIKHTQCIGGLDNFTIQDVNSQLAVNAVGKVYLAAVSSRSGDEKSINCLTKIVAPTVIRLAQGMVRVTTEIPKPQMKPEQPQVEAALPTVKEPKIEPATESIATLEPVLSKTPSVQFMVEKFGGFLVASDTVRLDIEVIEGWKTQCADKTFSKVVIETLEGKHITCKFKPQSGAKGVIGVPEKILQALDCGRGTLVMVKPLIESRVGL
jgi:hypothetical protein